MNIDAARELIARHACPLPAIDLHLSEALGCRLAAAPRAETDLPAADVSTMDGYAARAVDLALGVPLVVAYEVPAGRLPPPLPLHCVARIFTGAVLPEGADTVVPQEEASVEADGRVRLRQRVPCGTGFQPVCGTGVSPGSSSTGKMPVPYRGSFVRRRGELCQAGSALAGVGDVVTPQLIALLGAAGAVRVSVTPRPRVAVVSTGSELVPIDESPAPGRIRDSNQVMLTALARRARFPIARCARVPDELPALRTVIREAASEADLVLTTGGVSVGDHDLVPRALEELGAELLFHKLPIRPGKPILVARLESIWIIGLPGNPVSAMAGWCLFARPLGEVLAGEGDALRRPPETGVLTDPAENRGGRVVLAPACLRLDGAAPRVTIRSWKGSHDVAALAQADAFAVLEVGVALPAGARVRYYRLE